MTKIKLKTHRGSRKRFECKGSRAKRGLANGNHILTKQSGKKKRQRSLTTDASAQVQRRIQVLLKQRNAK